MPDNLELKRKNGNPCKASFLDLSLEIHDTKFTTKLFNRRDAFLFNIHRIIYLNNNISSKIFHS